MKGFRKINGVNWLNDKPRINVTNAGMATMNYKAIGKLPLHWTIVKNILLLKE